MYLILDLDDTIFETASMDMSVFEPARMIIEEYAVKRFGTERAEAIIDEIKRQPFDVVADKYRFPYEVSDRFYSAIQTIPYNLEIKTFGDYEHLQKLPCPKFLVTTGIAKLQNAKIDALDIRSDFENIFIDDPFDKNRKFKKGIFQQITKNIDPKKAWVIGDNPDSELKTGKDLGMKTVQRINPAFKTSKFADYTIDTFGELAGIFEKDTDC